MVDSQRKQLKTPTKEFMILEKAKELRAQFVAYIKRQTTAKAIESYTGEISKWKTGSINSLSSVTLRKIAALRNCNPRQVACDLLNAHSLRAADLELYFGELDEHQTRTRDKVKRMTLVYRALPYDHFWPVLIDPPENLLIEHYPTNDDYVTVARDRSRHVFVGPLDLEAPPGFRHTSVTHDYVGFGIFTRKPHDRHAFSSRGRRGYPEAFALRFVAAHAENRIASLDDSHDKFIQAVLNLLAQVIDRVPSRHYPLRVSTAHELFSIPSRCDLVAGREINPAATYATGSFMDNICSQDDLIAIAHKHGLTWKRLVEPQCLWYRDKDFEIEEIENLAKLGRSFFQSGLGHQVHRLQQILTKSNGHAVCFEGLADNEAIFRAWRESFQGVPLT